MAASRIQRWAIIISAYDYNFTHESGKENSNADCLSRFPVENKNEQSLLQNEVCITDLVDSPVTCKDVREETHKDLVLSLSVKYLLCGNIKCCFDPFVRRILEVSIEQGRLGCGCLGCGGRLVIPPNLREKTLKDLHEAHPGVFRMKALRRGYVWWPSMDRDIEKLVFNCKTCKSNQAMLQKAPVYHWERTNIPWVRLHIVYASPFQRRMFLIIADFFSKCLKVIPVEKTERFEAHV